MKIFKKIFFLLVFICTSLILAVITYCFIPLETVGVNNFAPRGELAFLKLNLDKKNVSLANDIIDFRFAEEFLVESGMERIFLKAGARFFSPVTVRVLVNKGKEPDEFEYTILIRSSKLSRFMQIPFSIYSAKSSFKKDYAAEQIHNWRVYKNKEGNSDLKVFAVRGDTWLFMIKAHKMREIIDRLDENPASQKNTGVNPEESDKISPRCSGYDVLAVKTWCGVNFRAFFAEKENEPFLLYVNDENKILDFYLSKVKEKTSYDFFPTFSNLDEIFVCFGKAPLKHKRAGEMNFYFEKEADLQKAKKDIWFLSQVLKRMFEANFYGYEYDIEVIENKVTTHFALTKTRRE